MTLPESYRDAMTELQAILAELEGDDVDVDTLSAKVKRAFELIRFCRDRIHATEMEISSVVSELERPADQA